MTTSGVGSTSQTSASSGTGSTATAAGKSSDALTSRDTFLKLLVTQIQNQDPLNPTDGVQFLSQLTQISEMEQTLQMRQDLDSMKDTLDQALAVLKQNQTNQAGSSSSDTETQTNSTGA
jgi:flagellar basal-body rod modification protein FlgD